MQPVHMIAHLDALMNVIATVCLIAAFRAIRRGNASAHQRYMLGAIGASAVFLVFYTYYHFAVGYQPFAGQGWIRPVYFTLLATHVVLAGAVVFLVPTAAFLGLRGRFLTHKSIVHWAFPIWLYVSVTGVVVYLINFVLVA
ncbi:MAG: DUF420 domain-containing protein [Magnetococcales bacterium]|nr:DUF420 domain-containing protein [Magnetococcales bacterium]